MSYKIEIIESNDNPLMKRKEIKFSIKKNGGTPNRYEVKQKLTAMEAVDENLVFVEKLKTNFGSRAILGEAHVYESDEQAKKFEPAYMYIRNMPKDQREDATKKLKDSKKKKKRKV